MSEVFYNLSTVTHSLFYCILIPFWQLSPLCRFVLQTGLFHPPKRHLAAWYHHTAKLVIIVLLFGSRFQLPDQFPEPGLNLRTVDTGEAHFLRQAKQVLPV